MGIKTQKTSFMNLKTQTNTRKNGISMTFFRKKNKKISSAYTDEKEYIKSILQNEFFLTKDIADIISQRLSQKLVKRIEIEILELSDLCVKFECNLFRREMEKRENEVRALLPKTQLSDDSMYRIKISDLPQQGKQKDRWIYYGFV